MNDNFNNYEKILMEKRREVMERIEYLTGILQDPRELTPYHPGASLGDWGTDVNEREKSFALLDREEKYLWLIDRSLEEIQRGDYGKCRVCGKEIEKERLEAVPTTRICVPCKKLEKRRNFNKVMAG